MMSARISNAPRSLSAAGPALLLALLLAGLAGCSSTASTPDAASALNLVVVDLDAGRMVAGGPLGRAATAGASRTFSTAGHRPYDAASVSTASPGASMSQAAWIDVLRSARAPLDAVVFLKVELSERAGSARTGVGLEVRGRMIDLRSSEVLGTASAYRANLTVSNGCDARCRDQELAPEARGLGSELATELAGRLQTWRQAPAPRNRRSQERHATAYEIVLDGFSVAEQQAVERGLEAMRGYRSHRPTFTGAARAVWWLESTAHEAALQRGLSDVLAAEALRAVVSFDGRGFLVTRTVVDPEQRRRRRGDLDDIDAIVEAEGW